MPQRALPKVPAVMPEVRRSLQNANNRIASQVFQRCAAMREDWSPKRRRRTQTLDANQGRHRQHEVKILHLADDFGQAELDDSNQIRRLKCQPLNISVDHTGQVIGSDRHAGVASQTQLGCHGRQQLFVAALQARVRVRKHREVLNGESAHLLQCLMPQSVEQGVAAEVQPGISVDDLRDVCAVQLRNPNQELFRQHFHKVKVTYSHLGVPIDEHRDAAAGNRLASRNVFGPGGYGLQGAVVPERSLCVGIHGNAQALGVCVDEHIRQCVGDLLPKLLVDHTSVGVVVQHHGKLVRAKEVQVCEHRSHELTQSVRVLVLKGAVHMVAQEQQLLRTVMECSHPRAGGARARR
mmetsp:Transcript_1163/g.2921  ORF Transcript_1163/g.2921 Transcript_1163/m.2921 type:complete len:351 (+) Transcript_1163:438-1490(+)